MTRAKKLFLAMTIFLTGNTAAGDIAVIANSNVANQGISHARLANLFLVPGASWPDGQLAVPVDLKLPVSLKSSFYQALSGRSPSQIRAYWARQIFTGTGAPPIELATVLDVVRKVAETPGAIGYVPRESFLEGSSGSVKLITILSDEPR